MKVILTFFFIAISSLIQIAYCQVTLLGDCPGVKIIEKFDTDAYMGKWYESIKYPTRFEINGKCINVLYTKQQNGTISIVNTQTDKKTEIKSTLHGLAYVKGPGKLLVNFYDIEDKKISRSTTGSNYWVLGTNYKDYTVVFYCNKISNFLNSQLLWVLTRERNPSDNILKEAYKIIDENNLRRDLLIKTDQKNCL